MRKRCLKKWGQGNQSAFLVPTGVFNATDNSCTHYRAPNTHVRGMSGPRGMFDAMQYRLPRQGPPAPVFKNRYAVGGSRLFAMISLHKTHLNCQNKWENQ